MSQERSRPWHDPTPLVGFEPEWLGQFDTFQDWVSHASRALTGLEGNHGEEIKAICVDAKGRRCHIGGDFMRARDESAFPVRYFVTGRVAKDTATAEAASLRAERDEAVNKANEEETSAAWDKAMRQIAENEAVRLRAEVEALKGALKEKAEEQVAYWRKRQETEKSPEGGISEDGETYTPIGDVAAWQGGYCNGRMSEADWWLKTLEHWPPAPAHPTEAGAKPDPNPPQELCDCRIGDCVQITRKCREDDMTALARAATAGEG